MATVTTGQTFAATELVTNTKLENIANLAVVTDIVNADIASGAAIVDTKLATIATASKVSGAALTQLANIPAAAGVIPDANLSATAWTDYSATSTIVGGDGTYAAKEIYYKKIGKTVFVQFAFDIAEAHSSGTAFSFTLPVTSFATANPLYVVISTTNGLTNSPGLALVIGNTSVVNLYPDVAGATAFQNAKRKIANGQLWFEATT